MKEPTQESSLVKSSSKWEASTVSKEGAGDRFSGRKTPFAPASGVLSDEATLDSFVLSLQARCRSQATLSTYSEAIENLRRFVAEKPMPPLLALSGEHLRAFFKELYDRGNKPGSGRNRWASLSAFYGWAEGEGELPNANLMDRVKPPQVPDQILPHYPLALLSTLPSHNCVSSVGARLGVIFAALLKHW